MPKKWGSVPQPKTSVLNWVVPELPETMTIHNSFDVSLDFTGVGNVGIGSLFFAANRNLHIL